ncbi:MAG: biotin synthase BioB [Vampirovibrionales bacterium]
MMSTTAPNPSTQAKPAPGSWDRSAIEALYTRPLLDLVFEAQQVHRRFHDPGKLQLCTLSNIKSGRCPEDCAYCPQSARYDTGIETWSLPEVSEIAAQAQAAKAAGSSRFCMGAAWREVRDGAEFDRVIDMVKAVKALDMEVCVTLGLLNQEQAQRLKAAGVKAYNHNIDTSPEYYERIISTRRFEDRLQTIAHVQAAGMEVCCGGILGMGETEADRIGFIEALTRIDPAPTSIPINALVPVTGTPLGEQAIVDPLDMVRTIAAVRITVPTANIRLSAGRTHMSDEAQTLCFMAGANSIFTGDKLLTTDNPGTNHDQQLMAKLGLEPLTPEPQAL